MQNLLYSFLPFPLDRSEQVKVHLQDYFEKSKRAVSGVDNGLYLLCVQCFEVCRGKAKCISPLCYA